MIKERQVRRARPVLWEIRAPQAPLVQQGRPETKERLGIKAPSATRDQQETQALMERRALLESKALWVRRVQSAIKVLWEIRALQVSPVRQGRQETKERLGIKAPSATRDLQETWVPMERRAFLECKAPLVFKDQREPKARLAPLVQ